MGLSGKWSSWFSKKISDDASQGFIEHMSKYGKSYGTKEEFYFR